MTGGLHTAKGLDIPTVLEYVAANRTLEGFSEADHVSNEELLELPCDILAPCALLGQITGQNADRLRCRILAKGANGPTTLEADEILHGRGVYQLPDILANAGGVTVSYFEWVQDTQNYTWSLPQINERLREIVVDAYHRTSARAESENLDMRTAALLEGIGRVVQAKLAAVCSRRN